MRMCSGKNSSNRMPRSGDDRLSQCKTDGGMLYQFRDGHSQV